MVEMRMLAVVPGTELNRYVLLRTRDFKLRRLRGPFGTSRCEVSQGKLTTEPRAEIPSAAEGSQSPSHGARDRN
jgi:hypothetical protein